jgi:glycosyltransferase involved in cell wall biosynthesis
VPERVFVVPHAIDTELFANESRRLAPQRETLRAQWGLDESAVVFLFAGKFTENKRPADFVDAIAHASRSGARVAGLMVGDGPLRGDCEDLVRRQNLPIAFAGFLNQSRMSEAYAAADALVLPSTTETWGLVVNEAMACGLPCFVSDGVGCGPDLIMPGETGAVFRLGDTKALGQLMSEFAANTEQRRKMRAGATEQAQKYTLGVAVDRMVEAVETVTR